MSELKAKFGNDIIVISYDNGQPKTINEINIYKDSPLSTDIMAENILVGFLDIIGVARTQLSPANISNGSLAIHYTYQRLDKDGRVRPEEFIMIHIGNKNKRIQINNRLLLL